MDLSILSSTLSLPPWLIVLLAVFIVGDALILVLVLTQRAQLEKWVGDRFGQELLPVGQPAPPFELCAASSQTHQQTIRLSDYLGKQHVVLVFYPGDNTPGCTAQLCALRDDQAMFAEAGAVIFGINPASLESHRQFAEKHQYPFPILVDEDHTVAKAYHVPALGVNYRTVYIIGRDGTIRFAERGTPSNERLQTILKQLL